MWQAIQNITQYESGCTTIMCDSATMSAETAEDCVTLETLVGHKSGLEAGAGCKCSLMKPMNTQVTQQARIG